MTPDHLNAHWRELYEERAAIIEEGCHVSRDEAERLALADIRAVMARCGEVAGPTARSRVKG